MAGFEPTTSRLLSGCSTAKLHWLLHLHHLKNEGTPDLRDNLHNNEKVSQRRGSNPRPSAYEADALPLSYIGDWLHTRTAFYFQHLKN